VPVLGLLGMGQALIMIAGGPGIDLASGAILSLVGLAIGALVAGGVPVAIACLAGVLLGAGLGAVNGTLVAVLRIPSLMATLATLFVFGGFAVAVTRGLPITGLPSDFGWLGQASWAGIPVSLVIVLTPVALALHVMLTRTTIGSHMIAAGNDEEAARLLGVRVDPIRLGLYVLNGTLAALGAIILLSWLLAARPAASSPSTTAAPSLPSWWRCTSAGRGSRSWSRKAAPSMADAPISRTSRPPAYGRSWLSMRRSSGRSRALTRSSSAPRACAPTAASSTRWAAA